MITIRDYDNDEKPAWCPGCGNFQILSSVKEALVELNLHPHKVLFVSGIGQAGKLPHYLRCNMFNGLHGRTLPVATGAKIANHELTVIAVGGDGDGYGEGGNHLLHAIRRNLDITYIVHNNQIYGLTKGQASPTSEVGLVTKTTPEGVKLNRFNPLSFALSLGATFVARGYSARTTHLKSLIIEGIKHKGFSLIDVLQPCVSFNYLNTYEWYNKRVYDLKKESNYNSNDQTKAYEKAQEWENQIPIGILYRSIKKSYDEQITALKDDSLIKQRKKIPNLTKLIETFIP